MKPRLYQCPRCLRTHTQFVPPVAPPVCNHGGRTAHKPCEMHEIDHKGDKA